MNEPEKKNKEKEIKIPMIAGFPELGGMSIRNRRITILGTPFPGRDVLERYQDYELLKFK